MSPEEADFRRRLLDRVTWAMVMTDVGTMEECTEAWDGIGAMLPELEQLVENQRRNR